VEGELLDLLEVDRIFVLELLLLDVVRCLVLELLRLDVVRRAVLDELDVVFLIIELVLELTAV